MVRTARYKYAHYEDGSAELYDLKADPHERINLAGDLRHAETEHRLGCLLLEHGLRNQSCHARAVSRPRDPIRVALEEEYRKELEAQKKSE